MYRIPCLLSGLNIQEMNAPIHTGIDYLNQSILYFRILIKVHDGLFLFAPLNQQRLTRPSISGPIINAIALQYLSCIVCPFTLSKFFLLHGRLPSIGFRPKIITPESSNALNIRHTANLFLGNRNPYSFFIPIIRSHYLAISLNTLNHAPLVRIGVLSRLSLSIIGTLCIC